MISMHGFEFGSISFPDPMTVSITFDEFQALLRDANRSNAGDHKIDDLKARLKNHTESMVKAFAERDKAKADYADALKGLCTLDNVLNRTISGRDAATKRAEEAERSLDIARGNFGGASIHADSLIKNLAAARADRYAAIVRENEAQSRIKALNAEVERLRRQIGEIEKSPEMASYFKLEARAEKAEAELANFKHNYAEVYRMYMNEIGNAKEAGLQRDEARQKLNASEHAYSVLRQDANKSEAAAIRLKGELKESESRLAVEHKSAKAGWERCELFEKNFDAACRERDNLAARLREIEFVTNSGVVEFKAS